MNEQYLDEKLLSKELDKLGIPQEHHRKVTRLSTEIAIEAIRQGINIGIMWATIFWCFIFSVILIFL